MTGTDVELHKQQPLAQKVEWVKLMATANLLPEQYRNNPGNLFYAVEFADSLGVDRINAITSIHVIKGKPTASADLIASLVRKAGHKLRISGDDTYALAQLVREDDPDFTFEARWDVEKATAAKLWGTDTWKKYPAAMLRARAITEVVRMGASDALYGVVYTPEELGAKVDADGEPVEKKATRSKTPPEFDMTPKPDAGSEVGPAGEADPQPSSDPASPQPEGAPSSSGSDSSAEDREPGGESDGSGGSDAETPSPSSTPEPSPDADGAYPAEVVEDPKDAEPRAGSTQVTSMAVHFGRLGVKDKTERLYTIGVLIGRQVESSKQMSASEATFVLELLATCKDSDALQAAVIAADEKASE